MVTVTAEGAEQSVLNLREHIDEEPAEARSGLFAMKFMTKSIDRRKREAQEVRQR